MRKILLLLLVVAACGQSSGDLVGRPDGRPSSRPELVLLVDRTPLPAPGVHAAVLARARQRAAFERFLVDLGRYLAAQGDPLPGGPCPASIDREVLAVFGRADVPRVLTIIRHESRCRPDAANTFASCDGAGRHWARGLMQVCLPMHTWAYEKVGCAASQWAEVRCHLRAARELLRSSGWGAWRGAF